VVFLLNIPNFITLVRFLIIPIFGIYLFYENYLIAVLLFIFAGITDVLDGYIARKFRMITNFGKIADPLADKLMHITALIILTYLNKISIFIVLIIMAKELLMGFGSLSLYKKGKYVVSANWYGKLSSVVFYFVIITLIIYEKESVIKNIIIWVAVFFALFAFYKYSRDYKNVNKENINKNKKPSL
jgi:cardiolipin synthase